MKHPALLTTALAALLCASASASTNLPARAPARLEVRDQFDAPHILAFPTTNIVALTIADKKGSAQIAGWVTAMKEQGGSRLDIRGLADVGGVPAFLRGRIRKHFQEAGSYPVMLDWTGHACAQFGYESGVANVLIIAHDGTIHARFTGATSEAGVRKLLEAVEAIRPVATAGPIMAPLAPR